MAGWLRKGTPLASRVAQGVSGPSSSCVWNPRVFAAHQAPLSMGFPKEEYWSGVLLPSPTKIARRAKKDIETCHNNKNQFTNVSSEQERVMTAGWK